MREHLRGQLHPDAYVDAVRFGGDIKVPADALHPFGAAPADGDDAFIAGEPLALRGDGKALAVLFDGGDGGVEEDIRNVLQLVVKMLKHHVVLIRAEVPDGGVEKMQLVLEAQLFDVRIGGGIKLRARAAQRHVDGVDVVHQLGRHGLAYVFVQVPAEIVGDVVFAVRERARAAEAVHYRAGGAVYAALHALPVDGTNALLKRIARLENSYGKVLPELRQLVRGEYPAGTCSDYDDVVMLHGRLLKCTQHFIIPRNNEASKWELGIGNSQSAIRN